MYDHVLIPTDGSDGVAETLAHGIDLATRHDATVHSLYVTDRRQYLGAPDDVQAEMRERLMEDGATAVDVVATEANDAGLEAVTSVREGIPYRDIVEYVDEAGIDVIVMGTHGRTGRDRLSTLGSVTERVVKHAEVPVLVVNIGRAD